MRNRTTFLFVVFCLLWSLKSVGQWTNYTPDNTKGIQANSVRAIQEDGQGRIWFATEVGMFERAYDEGTWTQYTTANGLPSNNVNDILITSVMQQMLALTTNGIGKFGPTQFNEVAQQLTYPVVTGATGTTHTDLWIATNGGGIVRFENGNYTYYSTSTGLPTNFYRSAFTDIYGTVWFGTSNHGIVSYSTNEGWTQYTTADGLAGNTIQDICIDENADIWLAGSNGLSRFINGQWQSITSSEGANSTNYFDLELAPDGTIWAGGDNGIDIFENGSLTNHLDASDGLNSNYVTAICHDSHNIVWVGHAQDGTCALIEGVWRDYSSSSGLGTDLKSMTEDDNGVLYFSSSYGVTSFDGTNWRQYSTGVELPLYSINRVFKDPSGSICLSARYYNAKLVNSTWEIYQNPPQFYDAYDMLVALDGSKWFRTWSKIYRQSSNGQVTTFSYADFMNSYPEGITIDNQGVIWMLSKKGLFAFDNGSWNHYPLTGYGNNPSIPDYLAISQEGNPTFVIEQSQYTPSGTVRRWLVMDLKNGAFRERHWVPLDYYTYVSGIYFDSEDNLWISSRDQSFGCVRVHQDGLQEKLYATEGFLSNRINATCEDSQGHIWLLSTLGASKSELVTVGIDEPGTESVETTVVYPNPSRGSFTLDFEAKDQQATFYVHDISGRLVQQFEFVAAPNTLNRINLELNNVPSGVYIITCPQQHFSPQRVIINKNSLP